MNDKELQEKWPILKTKIKAEHPDINDDDLKYEFGQESELLLRLQEKLGKTNEEIRNWLSIIG